MFLLLRDQFASLCDADLNLKPDGMSEHRARSGGTRLQSVVRYGRILAHVREKSGAASSRVRCRDDPIM